jgi:uncharacterized NAD(P)/FAD-binding protein YdhS
LNWAFQQLDQGENDASLHESLAHTFLPRQLFGEYVRQRFSEAIEQRRDVELTIVKAIAIGCSKDSGRFRVAFDRAPPVPADVVVLGTSYGVQKPSDANTEKMPLRNAPVIHPGNAARLVREHRPNDAPFVVTEFMTHDSQLAFLELRPLKPFLPPLRKK